jgi:plasmid maintenance system killer protein
MKMAALLSKLRMGVFMRCGNWRITFGWIDGDAVDVDLEDYR